MNGDFVPGNHHAFELLEYWPAVVAAGYTEDDIQRCVVYAGPTYDDDNFYYCAYFGNPLLAFIKSSILVCRKKSDCSMVYAVNCQDFNLDTGPTYLGTSKMICRPAPVIRDDKLYLTSSWVTNIGPQLFCINKYTGQHIYSIAYNLPFDVEQELGVKQITVQDDYSRFCGSNSMINNLGVIVRDKNIYVGSSSLQNAYNPGLINAPGNINYTGYPFYTDQGSLTCIRERGGPNLNPKISHRTVTCAPPFRVHDKLSKTNPNRNPFLPGSDTVLIATITYDLITNPGSISGVYNFAQKAMLSTQTVIDATLFAAFWNTLGSQIYLTDPNSATTGPYTFAQILTQLSGTTLGPTPVPYTISASLTNISTVNGAPVSGQLAVWYVKELRVGDRVENIYDANALGYWGNAVWGETPYSDSDKILFGTGQSHSSPLSERLYFSDPDRNYRLLKVPLVDLTNQYATTPSGPTLTALNAEKILFNEKIRQLAGLTVRSPRGQMSYTDSVVCVEPDSDEIVFGVRTVPSDVYNFLSKNDPLAILPNPSLDIDGDLSSGIFLRNGLISAVGKHGAAVVIDISEWDSSCQWQHTSPSDLGIDYTHSVYVGPNGTLGGTNYSSSFSINKGILAGLTTNGLFSSGSAGSDGQLEKFVSTDGVYVEPGNSVAYGFGQDLAQVQWYVPLSGTQCGATTVYKKSALTCDGVGNLYSLNVENGSIEWTINASADLQPMIGGIAKPSVDRTTSQIFWIASYNLPLPPFANPIRKYGWIIDLDNSN